jgi:hypothetical protein
MTTFPTTLDDYLALYGTTLAQQAQQRSKPLHTPGKDATVDLSHLLRPPLEAQRHVVTAICRAWEHEKGIMVSAEMGVGKTFMAIAAADYFGRHEYRAIVMCPPHLCLKWEREIRTTLPAVDVYQIRSYKDVSILNPRYKSVGPEWYIVSQTRAKLGTSWKAAYRQDAHEKGAILANLCCPDCHALIYTKNRDGTSEPTKPEELAKSKRYCESCGAALWQWTNEFDRWPVAHYIHKKLNGYFDFLVVDESHQAKSANSAHGNAMGALAAAAKRVLTCTGTTFGGYAWHLKPTLFRVSPATVVSEGFTWEGDTAWNEAYGRIETKVVESDKKKHWQDYQGVWNSYSMGKAARKTKSVKPGVMPTLFGRHMIGNTVFLSLEDVADNLPELDEQVIPVEMDDEQRAAYSETEHALRDAVKSMLAKGDKRLLSQMLQTLLGYCDHPWGWGEIGYYERDDECGQGQIWQHVVTPKTLDSKVIRPKEQALIEFCKAERAEGRKVWVYSVMTDKRDVVGRLGNILAEAGLRTAVLRSSIETTKREAWIAKHAPDADVLVSHPQLVETGLDFFDAEKTYNLSSIWFHGTGYNLFVLRQASRRAWRIGQDQECRVRYAYYADTMQARAMSLMGKKLSASQSMEGKFSMEGLAALAGDEGTMETALARSLVTSLGEDLDVGRTWRKLGQRREPKLNEVEQRFVAAMKRKQMVLF